MSCVLEICVDSIESAKNAIEGGASRLEVCSCLSEGGLTPSPGLVQQINAITTVPLFCMIRIRPGDFVYSAEEINAMIYDIHNLKKEKVSGFVFGALNDDQMIDEAACTAIKRAAQPLPVTFHRAFDETVNPMDSLRTVMRLGYQRILTSGCAETIEEGINLMKLMIREADGQVIIVPGGGITKDNIESVKEAGLREFHASAKTIRKVTMNKVQIGLSMTTSLVIADKNKVRELAEALLPQWMRNT